MLSSLSQITIMTSNPKKGTNIINDMKNYLLTVRIFQIYTIDYSISTVISNEPEEKAGTASFSGRRYHGSSNAM